MSIRPTHDTALEVLAITELPDGFDLIVDEAQREGHKFLCKMRDEWNSGVNQFKRDREAVFLVTNDDADFIAIGGLNIDPYTDDPSVGRVRHLYVRKEYRGTGVGRKLMEKILDHAKDKFSTLRLRTQNPNAVKFYESMGFKKVVNSDSEHTYLEKALQSAMKEKVVHTGSCLCGAIKLEVHGDLQPPTACHCSQCRKHSGHFEASTDIPRSSLRIIGEEKVTWYHTPAKNVRRGFCSICGSSLFWDPIGRDWTSIAMGAFDTPTKTKLKMHVHVESKGDYYDLSDGLPHFQPPK